MQDSAQGRLLDRVRIWFAAPEQVQRYQHEVRSGPTEAEEWLLHLVPAGGRVLDTEPATLDHAQKRADDSLLSRWWHIT